MPVRLGLGVWSVIGVCMLLPGYMIAAFFVECVGFEVGCTA